MVRGDERSELRSRSVSHSTHCAQDGPFDAQEIKKCVGQLSSKNAKKFSAIEAGLFDPGVALRANSRMRAWIAVGDGME